MQRLPRRTERIDIRVSDQELAELRARAAAHRIPLATYLRGLALHDSRASPGHTRSADAWWASLPAARRGQLWRWLSAPDSAIPQPIPGQLAIPHDHDDPQDQP